MLVPAGAKEVAVDDRVEAVIASHRAAGAWFEAAGVRSFVRSAGAGEPVVLLHGLPASSFLYRKVIPELAARGFRALAFDLPGLGFADRPEGFDYRIRGLGAFAAAAVDALDLERFHLVVHDAGGPVGFELATRHRERILSLTVTNTVVQLRGGPFPGEILARLTRRVPSWLDSPGLWRTMLYRVGILDRTAVPVAEVDAYRKLAMGTDAGAAYLRIMRGLHTAPGGLGDYRTVLDAASVPYPVQLIWGAEDPILRLRSFGWAALHATGLKHLTALPARHFLHEDQAPAVAELVADHARMAGRTGGRR
jgi:pimeloyl-ACP methyl ester carboxylesterase